MSFFKTLLVFGLLEIGFVLLKTFFSFLLGVSADKLEDKSDPQTGKTSFLFLSITLTIQFLLTLSTNIIPCAFILLVLLKWEKIFAVVLMIVLIICLSLSFICFYGSSFSLVQDDGYKNIPAFILSSCIVQYITDWLIILSSYAIVTAFNCDDIIRAIIHIVLFSVSIIVNFICFILYIKKKRFS